MKTPLRIWHRIEPTNLTGSIDQGLAAPLADPLWQLGRQWQLGELTAEDAATPIAAVVHASSFMIDRLIVGDQVRTIGPEIPLEALVEPEPPARPDLRQRLAAGRDLRDRLPAAAMAKLVAFAKPTVTDRLERALAFAVGASAVDAELVRDAIASRDVAAVASELGIDAAVLATWYADYLARTGRAAPSAWNDQAAAYAFKLRARVDDRDVELSTSDYRGGRLDWSDLSAATEAAPSTGPRTVQDVTTTKLPVALSFAGGPARRYYELEPSGTSFSLLAGAPPDVATALLLEVALIYGGDWFVLPLDLPIGSLSRVDKIEVVDAFDQYTVISGRLRSGRWRTFECAPPDDPAAELLLVLPTVAASLDSEPIESVALVRDERANVVWAIEDVVPDALGLGRTIAHPPPSMPAESTYAYLPFVPPPASWFPLVRRGGDFIGAKLYGVPSPLQPQGWLLNGWPELKLLVGDVHDDGLRIERRWQVAFGLAKDGEAAPWVTWISRSDRSAMPTASSGIAADVLVPPGQG